MHGKQEEDMTLKGYFAWFKEDWQKVSVIVGLFLTIYLVVIVLPQNLLLFALLMSTPLYMLHEADEFVLPGRFPQFLNHDIYKTDPENGPLGPTTVFWGNMFVWIVLPLFSLWAISDLRQAAWIPYYFIFQAILHLVLGILGKRFLNPGMVSAWLVHVPWGIWTIWLLVQAGVIANPYWNKYLLIGYLICASVPVVGRLLLVSYRRRQQVQ
jgi:hypothetical protein